jgi:hypothetical protein
MNIFQIALFVFLVQEGIYLVTLVNYPLSCDAATNACIYFDASTISGTTLGDIMKGNIESGTYKTTPIEANVQADAWTSTGIAVTMLSSILYGSVFGMWSLIIFFFGSSIISIAIATVMQCLVYFFYACMLADNIRALGKGDING